MKSVYLSVMAQHLANNETHLLLEYQLSTVNLHYNRLFHYSCYHHYSSKVNLTHWICIAPLFSPSRINWQVSFNSLCFCQKRVTLCGKSLMFMLTILKQSCLWILPWSCVYPLLVTHLWVQFFCLITSAFALIHFFCLLPPLRNDLCALGNLMNTATEFIFM